MNLMLDLFDDGPRSAEIEAAIDLMAASCDVGRGAVFTRNEVVEAILDLSGYVASRPLHEMRLLEPSFGAGSFLLAAVQRLLTAFGAAGGRPSSAVECLADAVCGVELHAKTFELTRQQLMEALIQWGLTPIDASALCDRWLVCDDFLLADLRGEFDFVVGNPPYVRQERIPAPLLQEYRRRFRTLYDRADLYIPFFERSLGMLRKNGTLGFICANRWMKNRYGGPLRQMVADGFWLRYIIDLEGFSAFDDEVAAYPAITVIQQGRSESPTRAVNSATAGAQPLPEVVRRLAGNVGGCDLIGEVAASGGGSSPLLFDDIPRLALLRRIEHAFPTLEQAGCRVGIGVATGCDRVYIDALDALPVEAERKLPLVMASDLVDGEILWKGRGVLNPFDDAGKVVALDDWPRFAAYLETHCDAVAGRNVAKRSGAGWYRTIDRIQPGLLETPKILIPDIKGEGVFVIDEGRYYPHHNLYFIASLEWDLRALRALLRSSLTLLTVATYCTRMSGGFLRFQAQYLRRIRIPRWSDVSDVQRARLLSVANSADQDAIDQQAFDVYGLSAEEAKLTRAVAESVRVTRASTR
jgi:hypothetical protein